VKASCSKRGCKRRASEPSGLCKTHLKIECDRLFSLIVRSPGVCAADGKHNGNLQCAHLFSRRYLQTRWYFQNAVPLCAGHHITFTHDPIRWDLWMLDHLGVQEYAALRERALKTDRVDMEATLVELQVLADVAGVQ